MINKIFNGGFLAGHRTYLMSGIGILSTIGAYLIGDIDVFGMLSTAFPLAAIYFLRASNNTKEKKESKNANTRKVSK